MERERITISIKKSLLDEIDRAIDGVNIRNRSHAFETLSTKALDFSDQKNAVVLLGGDDALKQIPAVKENLKNLKKYGFTKVYIAVGYLADKIKDKLGDGKNLNLKLEYLTEGEGSGGAILPLKQLFQKTFLVFNSGKIFDIDLNKLVDFHKSKKSAATIVTSDIKELDGLYVLEAEVFKYIPKGFSMLETDILPKLAKEEKLIVKPAI